MTQGSKLHWISSVGGPLVLLDASVLEFWQGAEGDDYERACDVEGVVGTLKKDGHDILVLGDEPLETMYHRDGQEDYLVQWMYAPDEDAVIKVLEAMPDALASEISPPVEVCFAEGRQLLADAAFPGSRASDHLELSLTPGRYSVHTFDYKPSDDIHLVVHKLVRSTTGLR